MPPACETHFSSASEDARTGLMREAGRMKLGVI